jgi:hypothetical protein
MLQKSHTNKQNPMAKEVRQPKYRQQVVPDKKKPKPQRKDKHKGARHDVSGD